MKKAIKIIVIVLLVVAAVATTCFLFFRNYKKEQSKKVSLLSFSVSEEKVKMHAELAETINIINSDGTDERFEALKTTLANLDSSYRVLATYYLDTDFIVDNENIAKSIKTLNSVVSKTISVMNEYQIKAEHTAPDGNKYFNRHVGANDLFSTLASFSVEYANLIKLVNSGITDVNKNADAKFAIINVYADVTINTYSNVETKNSLSLVKTEDNIKWLNSNFKLDHLYLETQADAFTVVTNKFIRSYEDCNTELFASDLSKNINSVTEIKDGMTKEEVATYYFKEVMG